MNAKKTSDLKKHFDIKIAAKDFAAKIEEKLAKIAQEAKLPGFRAGHAPKELIKSKYENAVKGEALDELIQAMTEKTFKDNNIRPALRPKVEIKKFEDGKDIEYTIDVEALPEIKPADMSKLSISKLKAVAGDKEVEEAINRLAQSRRTTEVVDEKRATKKGDIVVIDFVGSIDGKEFKGGNGKDYYLDLGSNTFIPGFEDQLIGHNIGDKVDVNVTFPENYHAKDLAGKKALFKVDLKELRRVKNPEINDDFAKSFGSESLEKLKEMIVTELNKEYDRVSRTHAKRALLDVLADAHDFEVPAGMVDLEFDAIWKQFEQAKKNNQLDEDEKSKSEDELKKEYRDIAERRVRLGLLLAEIANQNKITLTQEDISGAIVAEARRYPGQEKVVFEYYQKNPQALDAIKAPLFEEKVVDFLLGQIKSDEKTVSVKELYDFNPDDKETKKKK